MAARLAVIESVRRENAGLARVLSSRVLSWRKSHRLRQLGGGAVARISVGLHRLSRRLERPLQRGQRGIELIGGALVDDRLRADQHAVGPVAELLGLAGQPRILGADDHPSRRQELARLARVEVHRVVAHERDRDDRGPGVDPRLDRGRECPPDDHPAHALEIDALDLADRHPRDPHRRCALEPAHVGELHPHRVARLHGASAQPHRAEDEDADGDDDDRADGHFPHAKIHELRPRRRGCRSRARGTPEPSGSSSRGTPAACPASRSCPR